MAVISIADLNKSVDYWTNFNSMVKDHKPFKVDDSLGWAKNEIKINADDPRWKNIKTPDDLSSAFQGTGKLNRSVILPAYTGRYGTKKGLIDINLKHLAKDNIKQTTRAKYNLGNVAEGILAAAMAARFEKKDKDITVTDLAAMIHRCIKAKTVNHIELSLIHI